MFSSKRERREAVIRTNLVDQLKESVQSLIQGPGGGGIPRLSSNCPKGPVLGHTENTNVLCNIIEAIFIHGLRDTLGEKLSSMFLGDLDRMPVPNFWPVIMVISHRDLMEQISLLSFIMNDVGKGRAWMRLALNQGQLISYLSVLASDQNTLKDYYKSTALLRDLEKTDIMLRVLNPLTGLTFNLATNAAILNTWTQTPLILSGTWIPSNYEQVSLGPVLAATDVASTFDDDRREYEEEIPQETSLSDQMFDLIINGTPETDFIDNNERTEEKSCEELDGEDHLKLQLDKETFASQSPTAKKRIQTSPLSDDKIYPIADEEKNLDSISPDTGIVVATDSEDLSVDTTSGPDPLNSSFGDSLTRSVSLFNDSEHNEYRDMLSQLEAPQVDVSLPDFLLNSPLRRWTPVTNDEKDNQDEEESPDFGDFVVLEAHLPTEEEMFEHLPLLTSLQNEWGLDRQHYQCVAKNCKAPVGIIYGKPRICHYDGRNYCYSCHQGEESLIPAKIVHNWDFKLYSVCTTHKRFLDSILMRPLINIRTANPKLYKYFEDLAQIQSLRTQLHFIQAYLFTCQQRSIDEDVKPPTPCLGLKKCSDQEGVSLPGQELRQQLWPREHLYEHVHLYSVHDLIQVHKGLLLPSIRQAMLKGRTHVMRCPLCCPRGFICELCSNKEILYPFQLEKTHTCTKCSGVFHKPCFNRQPACPKCVRFRARKLVQTQDVDS